MFQAAAVAALRRRLSIEEPLKVHHPSPYQGSKRNLAPAILGYIQERVGTLMEPFSGSAARYVINDLNKPLVELWRAIIKSPEKLARQYETLWRCGTRTGG